MALHVGKREKEKDSQLSLYFRQTPWHPFEFIHVHFEPVVTHGLHYTVFQNWH